MRTHHAVSADGRRFLMVKEDTTGASPPLIVVQRWVQELERLLPRN